MKTPRLWSLSGFCLLLAVCAAPVWAEEGKGAESEKEAIAKRGAAFVEAFHAGDAKALAAFWTTEGDYTDRHGKLLKGRGQIEKAFAGLFAAHRGLKVQIDSTSLKFVTPEVAIEDGSSEVVAPDGTSPSRVRYTIVHVKQQGEWLISSVRDAPYIHPTNYENLQGLEPAVGEWVGEGENGESERLVVSWSENQNFLHAEFSTQVKEVAVGSSHQWIGWDPLAKKVRSWIFDATGGFGEGAWTIEDKKWTIRTSSIHRDGKKATATLVVLFADADSLTLQSRDRTLDGESLPGTREVKLKRVK